MIDPRISLASQAPNLQSSITLFDNTLNNIQNRRMNQQNMDQSAELQPLRVQAQQQAVDAGQMAMNEQKINQNLQSIASFSPTLRGFLKSGDNMGAAQALQQRIQFLERSGRDATESKEALQAITNGNPDEVLQYLDVVDAEAVNRGLVGQGQGRQFAPEISPLQTDPETGQQYVVETDKNTGQARRVDVAGARQRTGSERLESELTALQRTEAVKGRAARANEIKKTIGERNRSAARAERPLKQALKLVATADQGLTGALKLQLSRLLPSIDVQDEGQLDAVFNQLALEQLQNFKGPTTDFEFGVTQDIAGRISDPRTANEARIKSLDRNNWFNRREFEQFKAFEKAGGDPDEFAFDFQEKVNIKGKDYTLENLQDTAVANNFTIEETIEAIRKARERLNR